MQPNKVLDIPVNQEKLDFLIYGKMFRMLNYKEIFADDRQVPEFEFF